MMETIAWSDLLVITGLNFVIGGTIGLAFIAYANRRKRLAEAKDLAEMQRVLARARARVRTTDTARPAIDQPNQSPPGALGLWLDAPVDEWQRK